MASIEELRPTSQELVELRLLVAHRRALVAEEATTIARLREALVGLFPALERTLDWTTKSALILVVRYQTPEQIRRAGRRKVEAYLRRMGVWNARWISVTVVAAAQDENMRVPAQEIAAQIVVDWASDALRLKERIEKLSRLQTRGPRQLRTASRRYRTSV